ncbi:MAG TPA: NUDIX pyrophosphatase [Thermoplasmata archaeon]|nr:NUDIX pyrophosphatase [Thermoplasmata archaeon]
MEFEGTPLGRGRATGPAHIVSNATVDQSPGAGRVLVVGATAEWPRAHTPVDVVGLVLDASALGGPVPPGTPVVGDLPSDLFREGETVAVDGDRGTVTVSELRRVDVVTAFLQREDGRILLLRRSGRVGSFQGRWAGVSGYLEDPRAEGQAYREVREETGLLEGDLRLLRTGRVVYARDGPTVYAVRPFLFRVGRTDVRLDWEHTDSAWVAPSEIGRRPTVPNLDRAWRAVAPPGQQS